MAPVDRPPLTTRERILTAAIDVMHTRGIAAATTRTIAGQAGISEGLIYRYFQSKLDVLRTAVHEYVVPAFNEALLELPLAVGSGDPAAHLERIANAALAYYRDLVPLLAALFSDNALIDWYRSSLRANNGGPHRAVRIVGEYVAAEQERGRIPASLEPLTAAHMLLGALFQHVFFALTVGADRLAFSDAELARAVARNVTGEAERVVAP
jgi:AcrR family transcriptional regulator